MTSAWTADHVRRISPGSTQFIPAIMQPERTSLHPERFYWDMWPVQDIEGGRAIIAGRELWMALVAPDRGDPALRHFEARIHWLERQDSQWNDLGPVLSGMAMPYEREWSGSAVLDGGVLTLFFTAAGTAGNRGGYQQSIWCTTAPAGAGRLPCNWSTPVRLLEGDGTIYVKADAQEGEAGKIKAFRDPAWFHDPHDGADYLTFSASLAASDDPFNGAFGLARREAGVWQLQSPLITADGVNNELERAHLVFHAGRYYAFWSTQSHTFAPGLHHAPGGLYGMVAERIAGPWQPLNGSGLVLANPTDRPQQSYSWFVDANLTVCSFVDMLPDGQFGGVPAPLLQLALDGERACLRPPDRKAS